MSSRSLVPLLRRGLLLACALAPLSAVADLHVLVVDQDGLPLANSVVESRHEALQRKENASALSGIRGDVTNEWPGQVLGNPAGKITLL